MNFYISSEAPALEKCTEKLPKFPKRYTKKRKKKNDFGARLKNGSSRKAATLDDVTMTKCLVAAKKCGHNWLMWTCKYTDVIACLTSVQMSSLLAWWPALADFTRCHLSLPLPMFSVRKNTFAARILCLLQWSIFHPTINMGLQSKEWWDGLLNVVFSF